MFKEGKKFTFTALLFKKEGLYINNKCLLGVKMNIKGFLKRLKNKFNMTKKIETVQDQQNINKLTTAWFINSLPTEIAKREDAESLLLVLAKLDSEFSGKDFLSYVSFTPKQERELLGKKMIELVDAYLRYELEMTEKMSDFINTRAFGNISEQTLEMLCKYGNDNFANIRKTINLYRNLINFICQ